MTYEFRPSSFLSLACGTPARLDVGPEWEALHRESERLFAYGMWTDCELQEHEDRANAEDCWCDWWRADWVKAAWAAGLGPERCEGCDEFPCLQTEDCPGGRHYERQVARYGEPIR